jgi:hypothetical protein
MSVRDVGNIVLDALATMWAVMCRRSPAKCADLLARRQPRDSEGS